MTLRPVAATRVMQLTVNGTLRSFDHPVATVADLVQAMNHQAAAIQQLQREAAELKRLAQRSATPLASR